MARGEQCCTSDRVPLAMNPHLLMKQCYFGVKMHGVHRCQGGLESECNYRRRQLSTGQPNLHVSAPLSATCSLTHHQPLGQVQSTAQSPSSPSVTLLKEARCQRRRLKLPEGWLTTGPRHAGVGSNPSSHARRARPTRDGYGPRSGWSPVRETRKAACLRSWSSAGALGISR